MASVFIEQPRALGGRRLRYLTVPTTSVTSSSSGDALANVSNEELPSAEHIITPVRDAIYKSLRAEQDDILVDQEVVLRRGEVVRFGRGMIGSVVNAMARVYYMFNVASGTVSQAAGSNVVTSGLQLQGGAVYSLLSNAANNVDVLTATLSGSGTVTYQDSDSVTVGDFMVTGVLPGGSSYSSKGITTVNQNIAVQAANSIYIDAPVDVGTANAGFQAATLIRQNATGGITAGGLQLRAGADGYLAAGTNDVDTIAANQVGNLHFIDADGFADGTVATQHGATSELERIETVLDYHLFIVEDGRVAEQRDESARTGLGHGVRLVQQLAERLDRDVARIYHWFITTSADHMDDALAPLRAHRPDEISHALATRAQRARPSWWSGTSLGALTRGARGLYTKATPLVLELVRDLRGALRDDRPRLGYWDLAIASDTIPYERLPPLYRRLFGEIPLGLADLYQPRPNLETACRRVFETWLSGQPRRPDRRAALLVIGDRGAGKRTLVNRVRSELHGELPVRWLSLGPHLASEARLSAAICEASGAALAESFRELGHALRALGQRQAIVLENAEQLFVRTPEGLGRVQAFLDLVRATDDTMLWVVLMAKPAAALLDTCLRLPLYFGEVIRVEPESPAFLEAMVRARHRVSGLGLRFRARRAPVLQRLRAPFTPIPAYSRRELVIPLV